MQRAPSFDLRTTKRATLTAFGFMAAMLSSVTAQAASSVYLTNNTSKPIKVEISSTLPSKHWDKKSTYIPAFSRTELFETNRDKGVTDGKTFTFTAKVLPQDPETGAPFSQFSQPFALRLKLKGSTVGSHMWQSVRKQSGAHASWNDDRQKYGSSMNIDGAKWNVTYWAYGTSGDDDVEYVIRENYPLPVGYGKKLSHEWKRSHLNVLSYNIYMRPTSLFKNGQSKRAKLIPPQLPGYDVIVFQEAFDDDTRAELLAGMSAQGYKHHSKILGKDKGAQQDGGVIIVSRWPIADQAQRTFGDTCGGDDCLADKGVLYVKINKKLKAGENNFFHVFGTHLNNGNWTVQKGQLGIMRSFIDSRKIPKTQAVMITGDMNINRANTSRYTYMLNKLGAGYFDGSALKGHPYTHDGPLNDLGDGSQSYIDYVLYSKRHLKVTTASFAEVRIPRAQMEWKEFAHEKAMWDLSDHYAVYGNMHFDNDPLSDWDPGLGNGEDNGPLLCNSDADCPSEMRCEKKLASKSPTSSNKSNKSNKAAPAASKAPRASASATAATKAKVSKGSISKGKLSKGKISKGKLSKGKFSKTMKKFYSGVCRIPPPK